MKKLLTILCLVLLSSYSYSEDPPLNGSYEEYYENGQLHYRGNFKNGEYNGPFERYYENGHLDGRGNYKDGNKHGLFETFYENGRLEIRVNFKDGKKHGLFEYFYENGETIEECYKNDEEVNMSYCEN